MCTPGRAALRDVIVEPGAGGGPTDGDPRKVLELGTHLIELLDREFPAVGRDRIEAKWHEAVLHWHESSDASHDARDVGCFYT